MVSIKQLTLLATLSLSGIQPALGYSFEDDSLFARDDDFGAIYDTRDIIDLEARDEESYLYLDPRDEYSYLDLGARDEKAWNWARDIADRDVEELDERDIEELKLFLRHLDERGLGKIAKNAASRVANIFKKKKARPHIGRPTVTHSTNPIAAPPPPHRNSNQRAGDALGAAFSRLRGSRGSR